MYKIKKKVKKYPKVMLFSIINISLIAKHTFCNWCSSSFQTNGLFSSSSPTFWWSSWILWSSLWAGFELLGLDEFETLWCGLLSGKSFNVIPIPMSRSPVPCSSVNGFVNIKYDSNNVTAFLAVVICKKKYSMKIFTSRSRIYMTRIVLFVCSSMFMMPN